MVSCLSPNLQSWFSIAFQISVGFLDVEKHGRQQPVDDAVIVALRDQPLAPYALDALHRIEVAELVQVLKFKIQQGFLDEQVIVKSGVLGIRPQAAHSFQLLPQGLPFVLKPIALRILHAAKLLKIPKCGETLFPISKEKRIFAP